MQSITVTGVSPSFTSHSSNNLADVAARVVEELRHENSHDYDDIFNFNDYDISEKNYDAENDEDEFEFAVVCNNVNSSSISADEIFSQGHILPRYPLFDRSLLLDVDPSLITVVNGTTETDCKPSLVVRLPLRKLFSEERDFEPSSSSDGVTPGTYCVWNPKTDSPEKCNKSNSSRNSSRRWKFRDILHRSNSVGNEKVKNVEKSAKVADGTPAENKPENGVHRRRLYLPSGQALVGAFTTVSRSNRNLRPF